MQGGGGIVLSCLMVLFFQSAMLFLINIVDASPPRLSAAAAPSDGDRDHKQIYIVYMSAQPPQGLKNLHSYYLHFLSSVLGSEETAKDAIVYTYTIIAGFSAKLTPDQASLLDEQPEVVYVMKEVDYSLLEEEDGDNI